MTVTLPGKQPAHIAAGPYGHPTHPMMVMLPIGAWASSLALDLLARGSRGERSKGFGRSSRSLIGVGIFGALSAAVPGLLDYSTLPRGSKARKLATAHMLLNIGAVASYSANYLRRPDSGRVPPAALKQSLVTMSALGVSGFIGGELSYRYGVRVADEHSQARGLRGTEPIDPYAAEQIGDSHGVANKQGIDPYA